MASGKGDIFNNDLLLHILENADIATIGDAGGLLQSVSDGSVYVSLHTAGDPSAGDQETNEVAYTSYARVAVARTAGAWTTAAGATENTAAVTFPECTGLTPTAAVFVIGTASTGAGKILYWGDLDSTLAISAGITPEFAAGALDITEA